MKHFKILKNRPPLSQEQLVQDINFETIITKSTAFKTITLKSIVIKWFVVISIITISIVSYTLIVKLSANPENSIQKNDTASSIPKPITCSTLTETSTIKNSEQQAIKKEPAQIKQEKSMQSPEKNKVGDNNIPVNKYNLFEPKRCVIWIPGDYCKFPKHAKFGICTNCLEDEIERSDCTQDTQTVSCIWLRLMAGGKNHQLITDKFRNFALFNDKNEEVYPFMIKVTNEKKAWGADLKGKTLIVEWNGQIDMFLFFRNIRPKVGRKFRIDNKVAIITG